MGSYSCVYVKSASPTAWSRWSTSAPPGEEVTSGSIFGPCWQLGVRSPTAPQSAAPAVMGAGGAGRSVLVSHMSPDGCCGLAGTAVVSARGLELQDFCLPLGALQGASCAALNNSSHPSLLTGRNRKEQS